LGVTVGLAVAFLVLAFAAVVGGTLLLSVPVGLIVCGLLLGLSGVALLPSGKPTR
jgi:hypothetical protein